MKIPFRLLKPKGFKLNDGKKYKMNLVLEVFDNKENMNLIGHVEGHNIVVNQGLDSVLDVYFSDGTQINDWYCIVSETDTSPASGMTYAVPVFTEWESYDEANRPAWQEGGVSSQEITNSANKAVFTANATKTLYGAGLVGGGTGAATKGNTAGGGTLFNYGSFAASQPVVDDNVVNLTIAITAADDAA